MKNIIAIFFLLLLSSISRAELSLEVIYPKPDQRIPSVDSTFIFGNATSGADLRINGLDIPIHKDGGWLAFLPIERGPFLFHLEAVKAGDTASLDFSIWVGPDDFESMVSRPLIPNALLPDGAMIYSAGDVFEFSFEAPPGGAGWFSIDSRNWMIMTEADSSERIYRGEVFGGSTYNEESLVDYATYTGYYRFAAADSGRHCIYYKYEYREGGQISGSPERREYLNTDSILTVMPEFPPLVGIISGSSSIVRTGPGLGYKLLYQPSGVKARIRGAEGGYYRLALADGVTGFTDIDSVTLLPPGSLIPSGRISFISVDCSEDGIVISAHTGERLPYEIKESISPLRLDIDIFGAIGDVDWIRYNNGEHFNGLVKWSQPRDDIFRISVESGGYRIGGYKAYYDGNTFVLEISKRPVSSALFYTSLKGLKIVIDPGHSHDSGAVGPTGLREENANLWIGQELRLLLEKEGAEVLMTRYGHENVALYERPAIAEKWGADLLISIHNNALPDGINPFSHNGTSVYYYHPHSKPLAEAIHKRLVKATGLPDHGLYHGNLALTRPSAMPAVLVECAFMMIPEQEAMLKTDKFQRKCARAILEGIKDYMRK